MSCSLSFTECFGRYARSVCHSAVVRVRFLQNKIMACVPTIQLVDTDRNWPAGTGSRPSFGLHNLRLFSSCYLFTFQPVSCGIFTSCLLVHPVVVVVLSVGPFRVCILLLYLFCLISFALEYLLLISIDIALILLSRSCFVAASCCSSACEFK